MPALNRTVRSLKRRVARTLRRRLAGPPPLAADEYPSCWWIEDHVEFDVSDSIHFCCYSYPAPHGRPIFGVSAKTEGHVLIGALAGREFPVERLVEQRARIRARIANGEHPTCLACPSLKRQPWPVRRYPITHITINSWTACNLRCVYCFTQREERARKASYDLVAQVASITSRRLLDPDGTVVWGGGDVSSLSEFAAASRALLDYGVHQVVKTSARKYLPAVEDVLRERGGTIEVSLDAGTPDTYARVKGADAFSVVTRNVLRYARARRPDLKYIVRGDNCGDRDLDGFVAFCRECGAQQVTVTPDWDELFEARVTDPVIEQSARLIAELQRAGIKHVVPSNSTMARTLFHGRGDDLWARCLHLGVTARDA